MNQAAISAGGAIMASQNSSNHISAKRTGVVFGASMLIMAGFTLQWVQALCVHFVSDNTWFFATLFGQAWNMINIWLSAAPWHEDLRFWPLLLVITGAAILFSRGSTPAMATSEAHDGARRNA
jgi:hypothetical protein